MARIRARRFALPLVSLATFATPARGLAADGDATAADPEDVPFPPRPEVEEQPARKTAPTLAPVAYVEAAYSYNFARPSNGITNFRGYDNRHNTFALTNVALGGSAASDPVEGRLVLQAGQTPTAYYASEPARAGSAGAAGSDAAVWSHVQEAWIAYRAPVGRGIRLGLGVFLSPIGPETIPIKDNWNWSRSNLFFGLATYHAGLRATYDLTDRIAVTGAVYNGWNTVVDNNEDKSVSASVAYKIDDVLLAQVLYFGGVERAAGAPEGPAWRHDVDGYVQWHATRRVSAMVHANGGWENNRFGRSDWYAGALYGRVKILEWLFVAGRGDRFWEDVASNANGRARPISWPVGWVSSGTATVDVRPHEHMSVQLEYRHDHAEGDMFFRGSVAGDGAATPWVPNSSRQDTVTFGATGWL